MSYRVKNLVERGETNMSGFSIVYSSSSTAICSFSLEEPSELTFL